MSDPVHVDIFGQAFRLRSPHGEAHVRALAEFVDREIRAMTRQTRSGSSDRVAIMAAMQIADYYFQLQQGSQAAAQRYEQRIARLNDACERLLQDSGPGCG
ncbi:MAG: cell division protein ZapA [Magnetococcus sp. WYHC-3]